MRSRRLSGSNLGKSAGAIAPAPHRSVPSGSTGIYGGGIFNNGGTLTVTNSTFSGNSAPFGGGGVYNAGLTTNTIFANSPSGGNCGGAHTDGGHNIDDGATCGFTGSSTNPVLDPAGLQNNGGPTQTIALCTGTGAPSAGCTGASPAINAGDESICSTTTGTAPVDNLDQRGVVRPGTGATNCSIGAFEANLPTPAACVGDCDGGGDVTVNEIITMVNIVLGDSSLSACPAGDADNSGDITINEIIAAVNNALNGCPGH